MYQQRESQAESEAPLLCNLTRDLTQMDTLIWLSRSPGVYLSKIFLMKFLKKHLKCLVVVPHVTGTYEWVHPALCVCVCDWLTTNTVPGNTFSTLEDSLQPHRLGRMCNIFEEVGRESGTSDDMWAHCEPCLFKSTTQRPPVVVALMWSETDLQIWHRRTFDI